MRIRPIRFSFIRKAMRFNLVILLFYVCTANCTLWAEENMEYIMVKVISRPLAKNNEITPRSTKGVRHLAIISDILPHGVWEMGPDAKGMIATTNTIGDLAGWPIHQVTLKCIELDGDYIYSVEIEVNKQGFLDAIKLYEDSFAGKEKYSFHSYNENWAVDKAIYAAGGNLSMANLLKR